MYGTETRQKLKETIVLLLGSGMVRIELTDLQLDTAINMALQNYKQRSSGAVEEAFLHFTLEDGQATYTLPQEVVEVMKIYRRGHGQMGNTSGAALDPFSLAYAQNYMMAGAQNGPGGGSLLTYELMHQFQETIGRLFGREIIFHFNRVTKQITLHRDVRGNEDIIFHVYHHKPDDVLLQDYIISPWLRDWALAEAKIMLGRVRGKLSAIPGPNGSISLNGDALIHEGLQDQARLIDDLRRYTSGGRPLGFIIG